MKEIELSPEEFDELKEEIKDLCIYKTGIEDSGTYVMGIPIKVKG